MSPSRTTNTGPVHYEWPYQRLTPNHRVTTTNTTSRHDIIDTTDRLVRLMIEVCSSHHRDPPLIHVQPTIHHRDTPFLLSQETLIGIKRNSRFVTRQHAQPHSIES